MADQRVDAVFTLYDDEAVREKLTVMTRWEALVDDGRNSADVFAEALEVLLVPGSTYRVTVERIDEERLAFVA